MVKPMENTRGYKWEDSRHVQAEWVSQNARDEGGGYTKCKGHQESTQPSDTESLNCVSNMKESPSMDEMVQSQQSGTVQTFSILYGRQQLHPLFFYIRN